MSMNSWNPAIAETAGRNLAVRLVMLASMAVAAVAFVIMLQAKPAEAGYRYYGGYYGPYYGGRNQYYGNRPYRKRFYGNYSRYPYYPYVRPYAYYPYYARPVAPVIVVPVPRLGFGFSFGY